MPQNYQNAIQGLQQQQQNPWGIQTTSRPVPGSALLNEQDLSNPQIPGLRATPEPRDPGTVNYLYANRLKDELKDRMFNAQRAGDAQESGALKGLIGSTEQDIADSPITEQKGYLDQQEAANQAAQQKGFGPPAFANTPSGQAGAYERQTETAKVNAPVEAQRVQGQFDLQKQQEASKGALDVAKENQSGSAARLGAIQDLLQSGRLPGNISSVNPTSGAMGFRAEPQVPAAIDRDITNARQNLEKARAGQWSWGPFGAGQDAVNTAEQQFQAAVDTALSRHNIADPQAKQEIIAALRDPANKGKRIEEVFDMSQMTPQEQQQLSDFITLIGGF